MRYVPNLIPEKSRVLPGYFKGSKYKPSKPNALKAFLLWTVGLFFLLSAIACVQYPLLCLLMALIGIIFLPPGLQFIEKTMRFRFTRTAKIITVVGLFIASMPLMNKYSELEKQASALEAGTVNVSAAEKVTDDPQAQQRKDSINYYIRQSNALLEQHKSAEASKELQTALTFASMPSEKEEIQKEQKEIDIYEAADLIKAGKYKVALAEINTLLSQDPSNAELSFYQAVCYSKTGSLQEAVTVLKPLIQSGHPGAEELHDKINPIRQRVAYYVTRCWDGSTSDAKGRGACSHHGGVKNWNDPVFEEYRKYE